MAQTTTARPAPPRKPAPRRRARRGTRSTFSSMATLAGWQLRTTWHLLMIIGLGILAAVVLVCAIPLYVQVALSAGSRHTLAEDPQNLYMSVHAQSQLFSINSTQSVQRAITGYLQKNLGNMVSGTPTLSAQMLMDQAPNTFLNVTGEDMSHASGHVKLLQGRLPAQNSGNTIEFAATAQGAHDLNLQLGKVFTLKYLLVHPFAIPAVPPTAELVKLQLVGIITPVNTNDLYWHSETFMPEIRKQALQIFETLPILASNTEVMGILNELSRGAIAQNDGTQFANPPDLYRYYNFDFSHLDINQLPNLIAGVKSSLTDISNNPQSPPYVLGTTASGPLNVLQGYTGRVTVVELPTTCLAFLIAGLTLFFALLMTDVLVERQVAAIALLRSRGASARQVFGALLSQGLGLGLIAFIAGPLLAILGVGALANLTLEAYGLVALGLTTGGPLTVARGQLERDLIVVGLALLGIILSILRVLRGNILVLRRESARSTHKSFAVRFKLDLMAAVVALAGFGFSVYIESPGVLDVRAHTLILPLTSLVGVIFLLLGCLLLFLRFFPAMLRLGERLAARNRGAAPVLAIAQMARAPRQSLRMVLLFALAVAFALFTLSFGQAQMQRLNDVTTYQVGRGFTGSIPELLQGGTWNSQMAFYRGIKGVTSVTLGTSIFMEGGTNQLPINVNAVDASTYAQTMYWTAQDGSQPIGALTSALQRGKAEAEKKNVVPAIIDDALAQSLSIGVGQQFVLSDFHGPINFVVTAIVHYLPTTYDTSSSTGVDASIPQGGVLVDFQTLSGIELAANQNGVAQTQVWLRTTGQPADLANVHGTLFKGIYALNNGEDRRALTRNLATDPLYGSILGILVLAALVVLLLRLVGNLLVSWCDARRRRTSFVILRALGCAPGQIARVLRGG